MSEEHVGIYKTRAGAGRQALVFIASWTDSPANFGSEHLIVIPDQETIEHVRYSYVERQGVGALSLQIVHQWRLQDVKRRITSLDPKSELVEANDADLMYEVLHGDSANLKKVENQTTVETLSQRLRRILEVRNKVIVKLTRPEAPS
jgi:hypothetical protein